MYYMIPLSSSRKDTAINSSISLTILVSVSNLLTRVDGWWTVDPYPSHDCTFVQPYPYYGTACIPRLLYIYACTSPNCPRHRHLLLHFGALPSLLFSLLGRHPHASQRLLIFYDEATHGNLRLEDILRTLRN